MGFLVTKLCLPIAYMYYVICTHSPMQMLLTLNSQTICKQVQS